MLLSSFLAVKESAKVGEIRAMYVIFSNDLRAGEQRNDTQIRKLAEVIIHHGAIKKK